MKIEGKVILIAKTLAAKYGYLPLPIERIDIKQGNTITSHYPKKLIQMEPGDYLVLIKKSRNRRKVTTRRR